MKKYFIVFVVSVVMACAGSAFAGNYASVLSTYTVASDTTVFAGVYPSISGAVEIESIVISSTQSLNGCLVCVYDTATSTTNATEDGFWSVSTASVSITAPQYFYGKENPRVYNSPAFFLKASDSLQTDKVYIDVQYRKR